MRRPLSLLAPAASPVLLVALVVLVTGCTPGSPADESSAVTVVAPNATVLDVTDGDTIRVQVEGQRETVRLIGIDTPETKDPDEPVQCFGPEASAATQALLPRRTPVRLVRDVEPRDQYGRLLAYVYLTDGTFVNLDLARRGLADVLSIAPNTAHAPELRAAVDEARAAGRGLWGACPAFGAPA
jgi:micrococcal nuclease